MSGSVSARGRRSDASSVRSSGAGSARSSAAASSSRTRKPGPPHVDSLATLNHYDRSRVLCTCDDRRTAAQLGGHTWNIINNRKEDEVFLLHARNNDHFVDEDGKITSFWFEKKKRVDLDGDGVIDPVDSTHVQEIMRCPGTAGKQAKKQDLRAARQLYQAAEPMSYAAYSARRARSTMAPPTPGREDMFQRTVPFQDRIVDPRPKQTPRVVERGEWTPRRGERFCQPQPPPEPVMYGAVDQLRAENHIDATEPRFADSLRSARGSGALGASGSSAVAAASTLRSSINADLPPKPGAEKTRFSRNRIEDMHLRDTSSWPDKKHNLHKEDHYYAKPVQHTGSSSVKYDLITNERKEFWY